MIYRPKKPLQEAYRKYGRFIYVVQYEMPVEYYKNWNRELGIPKGNIWIYSADLVNNGSLEHYGHDEFIVIDPNVHTLTPESLDYIKRQNARYE